MLGRNDTTVKRRFCAKVRGICCVSARSIAPAGRVSSIHTTYVTSRYSVYLIVRNCKFARVDE